MESAFRKLKGLRILVAEDEMLVLMELEDMLRELGCEVVGPVSTVAAALTAIEESGLDGALLDMNLHGEQILPAVEKLQAQSIPFLLVTGYAGSNGDEPALRHAPRLTKPFSLQGLGAAMTETFVRPLERSSDRTVLAQDK